MDPLNERIRAGVGPEPTFDPVAADFLRNCREELRERCQRPGLLVAHDLGERVPWLWRLDFQTRGLVRTAGGEIEPGEGHIVLVRFLPDYLRRAERFEMLRLLSPSTAFHPNLRDGHICLQVYPGEPLVEVCESLHNLFAWRLRQLNEADALNPEACVWGRNHLDRLPLDARPLFGRALSFTLSPAEAE